MKNYRKYSLALATVLCISIFANAQMTPKGFNQVMYEQHRWFNQQTLTPANYNRPQHLYYQFNSKTYYQKMSEVKLPVYWAEDPELYDFQDMVTTHKYSGFTEWDRSRGFRLSTLPKKFLPVEPKSMEVQQ